jgi:hypothetical protein
MNHLKSFAFLSAVLTLVSVSLPAEAGSRKRAAGATSAEHPESGQYRGTRVKGYTERRGGYSYSQEDTINTYGDSRGRYGSTSSLRDPQFDRQTNAGPFDHGFFFDSGIQPRGGDSPYMN